MQQFIKYAFIVYMVLCAPFSHAADDKSNDKTNNSSEYKEFQRVFEKIQKDYVKEPNKNDMTDASIAGMLSSLDPQ